MIAGTRKRSPEPRHRPKGGAESRSRAPRGAAAGVIGRSSQAILRWVRSRDGPRVRRSAPAPVGALLPSNFLRAEKAKGTPCLSAHFANAPRDARHRSDVFFALTRGLGAELTSENSVC